MVYEYAKFFKVFLRAPALTSAIVPSSPWLAKRMIEGLQLDRAKVVVELGGGILVLIGWQTRLVAPVMAVWCIATALVAHLHLEDTMQMINFMKNVCMAGGFLQLATFGAGALSVDRR